MDRKTEPQAFASLSNWMDMVVTQHTCISISCYQVTVGMKQLLVQILLTLAAAEKAGPSELRVLLLQLPLTQIQTAVLSSPCADVGRECAPGSLQCQSP